MKWEGAGESAESEFAENGKIAVDQTIDGIDGEARSAAVGRCIAAIVEQGIDGGFRDMQPRIGRRIVKEDATIGIGDPPV